LINFCVKNVLGYNLGDFLQTHLVTLFAWSHSSSSSANEVCNKFRREEADPVSQFDDAQKTHAGEQAQSST
jgi:hypothetical protein